MKAAPAVMTADKTAPMDIAHTATKEINEVSEKKWHLSTDGGEPDGVYDVTDFMLRGFQDKHISSYMRWLMRTNGATAAVLVMIDERGVVNVLSEYHETT